MVEALGDGGIAHYTYNLLKAMKKRGISVSLFTTINYEFKTEQHGYEVYPVMFRFANIVTNHIGYLARETAFPSMLRRLFKLAEYPVNVLQALAAARKVQAQCVHLQSVNWIELIMVLAFRLAGLPVVFTVHNVNPHHKTLRIYHRVIYSMLYKLCNSLVIHSEQGKRELMELFNVEPGKVWVIPHGDYKFFVPEIELTAETAKERLGLPGTVKTILFFGAIRPNKGLDFMLSALPRICRKIEGLRLLIVGEPWENYQRYRKIIEQYQLEDNVCEYLRYVSNDEIPLFFWASDVVVLPYREITQSGVLQIAYAFSKPVVATDIEGFKEVIDEGRNGYTVPFGDSQRFAEILITMLSDEIKMLEMGKFSRFLADTRYSWEGIAEKNEAVYRLASSGRGGE